MAATFSAANAGGAGGRNLNKHSQDDGLYIIFLGGRQRRLKTHERGNNKGGTRVKHERAKQVPANRKKQVPGNES